MPTSPPRDGPAVACGLLFLARDTGALHCIGKRAPWTDAKLDDTVRRQLEQLLPGARRLHLERC